MSTSERPAGKKKGLNQSVCTLVEKKDITELLEPIISDSELLRNGLPQD